MASFRKLKSGWRAEVCVKGVRDSIVKDRKSEAIAWAEHREYQLKNNAEDSFNFGGRTVADLLERYQNEVSIHKKGSKWEITRLNLMMRSSLADVELEHISSGDVANWRDWRLRSVKGSSVNREMNILSNAFQVAIKEWGWLKESPSRDVRRPKESPPRDRRISETEIQLVRLALNFDQDVIPVTSKQRLAIAFLFAIETAMRLGEICSLKHTDIAGSVATLLDTKNGTQRRVPLSKRALELLSFLPERDDRLVFGLKSDSSSSLFRKYVSAELIKGLTFHDTRHEAITRLASKLDVLDLARMVGHTDIKMLMIYYNKSAEDIAASLG